MLPAGSAIVGASAKYPAFREELVAVLLEVVRRHPRASAVVSQVCLCE